MSEKIFIKAPQMGESITEGIVLSVNKKVGDFVEQNAVLFELETEKVTIEVVSSVSGVVSEILVKIDQVIKVGINMASITPSQNNIIKTTEHKIEKQDKIISTPFVSPSAQKIANDNNIKLENIVGTGKRGGILKEDVLFVDSNIKIEHDDELINFSDTRIKIIQETYNYHSFAKENIDVTKIISFEQNEYLSILIKAISMAVRKNPVLNALIFNDKILFKKNINIELNTFDNVRIVSFADEKTPQQISNADDNEESTLSLFYAPNILFVVPNITKNQSIAISVCRATTCHNSSYVNVCVSFDSRAVNIFDISNFCEEIKKNIENPYLMLFDK